MTLLQEIQLLFSKLPWWALWILLAVIVLGYLSQHLPPALQGIAKLLGPFGAFWIRRRERKLEEHRNEVKEEAKHLLEEMEIKPPDYEQIKQDVVALWAKIDLMEAEKELNEAYLVHDAQWHFIVDVTLAERGVEVPDRISYREFARNWRQGLRLYENNVWVKKVEAPAP